MWRLLAVLGRFPSVRVEDPGDTNGWLKDRRETRLAKKRKLKAYELDWVEHDTLFYYKLDNTTKTWDWL